MLHQFSMNKTYIFIILFFWDLCISKKRCLYFTLTTIFLQLTSMDQHFKASSLLEITLKSDWRRGLDSSYSVHILNDKSLGLLNYIVRQNTLLHLGIKKSTSLFSGSTVMKNHCFVITETKATERWHSIWFGRKLKHLHVVLHNSNPICMYHFFLR